ncbi:MAG: cupin domain-containing protein [Eudoraea sp.]
MCQINDTINLQTIDKLQVKELAKNEAFQILSISLEKGAIFPEHTSPTDAHLIVLEGEIIFNIQKESHRLRSKQSLAFPKETKHWVSSNENSKFLIVR